MRLIWQSPSVLGPRSRTKRRFVADFREVDLKVGKEWAVPTEPHPRFYTDTTDTVLVAVPTLLRTEWWPTISFVVFKSPAARHAHSTRASQCCRS